MKISYKYIKEGKLFDGVIDSEINEYDHHTAFTSALQTIANKEDVVISVGMMSSSNPEIQIGRNHFLPESGNENVNHTIEKIEVSIDDKEWKIAALILANN